MTRNDYKNLAAILGKHKADNALLTSIVIWLKDENPRFDEWHFRTVVIAASRANEVEAKDAVRERSRKRDLRTKGKGDI